VNDLPGDEGSAFRERGDRRSSVPARGERDGPGARPLPGDDHQVRPLDKTAKRLPGLVKDLQLVVEGGPHAIGWTHPDQVNTALLGFLRS
jgi:pimeloyl-ACP methyl ester carboxylesterase